MNQNLVEIVVVKAPRILKLEVDRMQKKYADKIRKVIFWIRRNVPFGVRSLIGVLLIVGGIFGFLPILGFWMLPLGIVAILIDWRDLRRRRSTAKQQRSE